MIIFRGPTTKSLSDESHEIVHNAPIDNASDPWHKSHLVKANVSKNANERYSTAHVSISADDVLNMHAGLIKGLVNRSSQLDVLDKQFQSFHDRLDHFQHEIMEIYETCNDYSIHSELNPLNQIAKIAELLKSAILRIDSHAFEDYDNDAI